MKASVRFAALLSILLVVVLSGVAWGTDGDPIIAGTFNSEQHETQLENTTTGGGALRVLSSGDGPTMTVENQNPIASASALQAVATTDVPTISIVNNGDGPGLGVGGGASIGGQLSIQGSGTAVVPAGSASVLVSIPAVSSGVGLLDRSSVAYATLQQRRSDWVIAAVPHPKHHTLSIYLAKPVARATPVAWLLLN
jgi:hypothetical protein